MNDPMNGVSAAAMGNIPVVNPLVDILEKVMAEVKSGRCTSLGIVMIDGTGGVGTPWAGPQIPQLYLACGMMQTRIIRVIESPPKSSIIQARMGG